MSLKVKSFDTTEMCEGLIESARYAVGNPVWRMAGPEIESFIRFEVTTALREAFSKAESEYIEDMVKSAEQSSRSTIQAVFAGMKLAGKNG